MKYAISTDGGMVSAHFGRCPEFTIVEIEDGKVTTRETVANPGHHPGFLPEFLGERGVVAIVAGGMGLRAQQLFEQKGIRMIVGIQGNLDDVIQRLLNGALEGGKSLCAPGAGKGYGIEKTECTHGEAEHGE
jgi:predicted Fe-Mo cluster-binding NifX family protein